MALLSGYFYLPSILGDTIYPLQYTDSILKWSTAHKVSPDLTAAIIYQESHFNPQAASGPGARGLMQIMPTTGASINKAFNVPGYNADKLYDPDTSIMFGTWYISTLIQRYDGNVLAALTAYNAGSGAVDRWFTLGLFGSGNSYAKRVLEYQTIYRNYYGRELFGVNFKEQAIEKPKPSFLWSRMIQDLVGLRYGS